MPCSYCKCTTHNRQRCDTFKQDIHRETGVIMARRDEDGATINRDLAVKLARKTLLERKHRENLEYSRQQRRQQRIQHWRAQRERFEREREQRNQANYQLENLVTQSVQMYMANLSEEQLTGFTATLRNAFPNGVTGSSFGNAIYRNMNGTRLARTLHNNFIPREQVKLVEKVEKQVEATECAICMEEFGETDFMVTSCGHKFHSSCMFKHLQNKNNCPCCRGVLF